ncbi:hypothetical protein EXIGLDRAFT_846400 [Exidia glandulosa HHB12029]|uniref:Uncharacterized protein n=1 Tax=Exidia glandulosa HHB12029 TaxID=1314781 RepID=A0A165AZM9_EXIGL|nr:hypothetical protein EXIGLDRAFT_846400 [Exidia glandulosa HHB12029]
MRNTKTTHQSARGDEHNDILPNGTASSVGADDRHVLERGMESAAVSSGQRATRRWGETTRETGPANERG